MSRPRILLCDDDREYKESLKSAFQEEFDIELVSNGDEALAEIEKSRFDIVLLDIEMRTRTEGLDLLPKIKQRAPQTSVIIISGFDDFDFVRNAFRAGAFDYMTKGARLSEIRDQLTRVLKSGCSAESMGEI